MRPSLNLGFFFFYLLAMGAFSCSGTGSSRTPSMDTRIIAHRGASAKAPENTLPAVEKAWELGADAVEVDVRVTKDERIVAIHDRSTERTTGRKFMVRKTSYDSLSELDAGSWFDPSFDGTRIPLLDSILDRVPADKELVIEIKSGVKTVGMIEDLLSKREMIPKFSIISFNYEVVARAEKIFPKIPSYWVLRRIGNLDKRLQRAKKAELDGLNFHHRNLSDGSKDRVGSIHEAGLEALCWTVYDSDRAKALRSMDVDGIITDHPSRIRKVLGY